MGIVWKPGLESGTGNTSELGTIGIGLAQQGALMEGLDLGINMMQVTF